jgi:EmrB/QacA subfamily drug resistance transporter
MYSDDDPSTTDSGGEGLLVVAGSEDEAPDVNAVTVGRSAGAGVGGVMGHRQILVVLFALGTGMLLAALDQTIVATALPTIVGQLGGLNHLSWVVTAYLLTSTASAPLYGKISDQVGRKSVFQVAVVIFLVGSALSGAAQSLPELIATRAIQGLGAGGILAIALAIVGEIVPPRERGRYVGYFGAVFALASVVGPLAGGFFVDSLSWRWVFYINLPLGIVCLVVTQIVLKAPFARHRHKIDFVGAALVVASVSSLLLVSVWGGSQYPWGSGTIVGLGGTGLVLLGLFVLWEARVSEPILPLKLFASKIFSVSVALCFIVGFAMFGAIIFMPVYLQLVKGSSATLSGLQILPLVAGLLLTSIGSGQIISRWGRYKLFPIIGSILVTIGLLTLSTIGVHTAWAQLFAYMFILGAGIGMMMQVLVLAVQNDTHPKDLGTATAATTFFRSMGAAFGTSIFGAIMASRLAGWFVSHPLAGAGANLKLSQLTASPSVVHKLPPAVRASVEAGFVHALHGVFLTAVPLGVVAFGLAWLLPEIPLRAHSGESVVEAVADTGI